MNPLSNLTPEQLQQMQQIVTSYDDVIVSTMPWWTKLIFIIFILGQLACLICLPLITWKLWQNGGVTKTTIKTAPLSPVIQERQARREAIRKLTETPQPPVEQLMPETPSEYYATDPNISEEPPSDDNSRFMPKE